MYAITMVVVLLSSKCWAMVVSGHFTEATRDKNIALAEII